MTERKVETDLELALLITMLKDQGASHLRCVFYGGGDSGSVESAFAYRNGDENDIEGLPEITEYQVQSMLGNWVNPHILDYDWYNNEGGDGYIDIEVDTLNYSVTYNICGEDKAEYEIDEATGEIDWDSAEPEYEYDTYYSDGGPLKIK